ncbi:MAG: glycosyl transferase family 1 [Chloroflexota bacterium]|nr:MAG: glycosyl transferase family 1 [Chloroflexota bacterium]
MRILFAVHGFPPTHSAGAERRTERMARWLADNGHHVEVVAVEDLTAEGFHVKSRDENGILVHRLFYRAANDFDPLVSFYDYPPVGAALEDILRRGAFDLMHIVSGYLLGNQAVQAARRVGIPSVITLTEFWFMCARLNLIQATGALCTGPESYDKCTRCLMEDKRRYRLPAQVAPKVMDAVWPVVYRTASSGQMRAAVQRRDHTLRAALKAVDLVICPSNYLIDKFAEFGFDTENFHFIRQGLARPGHSAAAGCSTAQVLSLGYIGQIKEHKGVDLLIDAVIPLLLEGKRIIVELWGPETEGSGYARALRARSAAFPANIRWQGKYTGHKVWDVLAQTDVLVMPSRWHENSPNAILEAFEMGVPVIATNLGGMAELVSHERSGLLFEFDSSDDLRRQIRRLLDEPGLLDRLRQGVPHVKRLDDEMQEIVAQYQRLLGRRPALSQP